MSEKEKVINRILNLYPEITVKLNIVDLADEKILKIVEDYARFH